MSAPDLQTFVADLEERGWLKRVSAEVDSILEITEIADRVTKAGGTALLFERVRGSRMPLLINTFGTARADVPRPGRQELRRGRRTRPARHQGQRCR